MVRVSVDHKAVTNNLMDVGDVVCGDLIPTDSHRGVALNIPQVSHVSWDNGREAWLRPLGL